MIDPATAPPPSSSSGSTTATDDELAKAFSQVLASMAIGFVQNNKPQIHSFDDD